VRRIWIGIGALVVVLVVVISFGAAKSSPVSLLKTTIQREWMCRRAIGKILDNPLTAKFPADWQTTMTRDSTLLRTTFVAQVQGVTERMTGICEFEAQSVGERIVAVSSYREGRS
jgi:hypothetical protein